MIIQQEIGGRGTAPRKVLLHFRLPGGKSTIPSFVSISAPSPLIESACIPDCSHLRDGKSGKSGPEDK